MKRANSNAPIKMPGTISGIAEVFRDTWGWPFEGYAVRCLVPSQCPQVGISGVLTSLAAQGHGFKVGGLLSIILVRDIAVSVQRTKL